MAGDVLRAQKPAGQVVSVKPLVVACGEGSLELLEVQLEGRKRISAADFANGQRLTDNDVLGELPI
jgi:methionyl-tRNA formyltransferase